MNFRAVFALLLVVLLDMASVEGQIFNMARRKRPGERRWGATNYGTHSFGKSGYHKHEGYHKHDHQ